jgi:hypothetical protein
MMRHVELPSPRVNRRPSSTAFWPAYDEYQAHTSREIPVVIIERA